MTISYRRDMFEIVDMPEHVHAALHFSGPSLPLSFALNPEARVTVLCDGTIRTEYAEGRVETGSDGYISWMTLGGEEVASLNGPLILEAADRLGIPVGHQCAPKCHHRSGLIRRMLAALK